MHKRFLGAFWFLLIVPPSMPNLRGRKGLKSITQHSAEAIVGFLPMMNWKVAKPVSMFAPGCALHRFTVEGDRNSSVGFPRLLSAFRRLAQRTPTKRTLGGRSRFYRHYKKGTHR